MDEYLLLKWGTLKGWNFGENEKAIELLREYIDLGSSMSVMLQKDTPKQKELICQMIDAVNGEIQNDWTGEIMTKEAAKDYVMTYR